MYALCSSVPRDFAHNTSFSSTPRDNQRVVSVVILLNIAFQRLSVTTVGLLIKVIVLSCIS